jgi:hypothetical protein
VKDCQNHEKSFSDSKEDGVWKVLRDSFSHVRKNDRISFRMSRRSKHHLIDFSEEFFTKPFTLLIVPRGGRFKLMTCRGPKDNAQTHRVKRACIDALISSHGITFSGNVSSSATRRSSSARCAPVSGTLAESAQMLAQISSTKASRSSTLSRSIPSDFAELAIGFSFPLFH